MDWYILAYIKCSGTCSPGVILAGDIDDANLNDLLTTFGIKENVYSYTFTSNSFHEYSRCSSSGPGFIFTIKIINTDFPGLEDADGNIEYSEEHYKKKLFKESLPIYDNFIYTVKKPTAENIHTIIEHCKQFFEMDKIKWEDIDWTKSTC